MDKTQGQSKEKRSSLPINPIALNQPVNIVHLVIEICMLMPTVVGVGQWLRYSPKQPQLAQDLPTSSDTMMQKTESCILEIYGTANVLHGEKILIQHNSIMHDA